MQKTPKSKAISENQKWKDSGEVFQVAQSILSKSGMEQYKTRLACVQKLISLWQEDKEAFVGEFVVRNVSDETQDEGIHEQNNNDESQADEDQSIRNSPFQLPNLPEPHEDLSDLMELENKSTNVQPDNQPHQSQRSNQPMFNQTTTAESEDQPAHVQPDNQPTIAESEDQPAHVQPETTKQP